MAYSLIATRLPKKDEKQLNVVMNHEGLDKSAAARKIIELGLSEWRKQEALKQLQEGTLSLSAAAHFAGLPIWHFLKLVKEKQLHFVHMTKDDIEQDLKALRA